MTLGEMSESVEGSHSATTSTSPSAVPDPVTSDAAPQIKDKPDEASMVLQFNELGLSNSTYHLKWINWNNGKIPIVMQSTNGPCPLIAIMNVSLLREKIKLPDMLEQITANQLLTYLGECLMDSVPTDLQNDEGALLNLEQNVHDAIEVLPKLETGLDVNIRFTGITDFEYTQEYVLFDLLRIPLYHGWLSDPNLEELQIAIGNQSYNQLVDSIITGKNSINPDVIAKVLVAEEFLEGTASQLTQHGLNQLRSRIKDNEIGVLFRNNHFLTFLKRDGEIYTLVTDHGYLTEDNVIWESLDNIEGAGRFFDSNFQPSEEVQTRLALAVARAEEASETMREDHELAKLLQAEEEEMYDKMLRERYADNVVANPTPSWDTSPQDSEPIGHFDPKEHPVVETGPEPEPANLVLDNVQWPTLKSTETSPKNQSSTSQPKDIKNPPFDSTRQPSSSKTQSPVQLNPSSRAEMTSNQTGSRNTIPSTSDRRSKQDKSAKVSNCAVS